MQIHVLLFFCVIHSTCARACVFVYVGGVGLFSFSFSFLLVKHFVLHLICMKGAI